MLSEVGGIEIVNVDYHRPRAIVNLSLRVVSALQAIGIGQPLMMEIGFIQVVAELSAPL
jgi:succinyl-CoA synthetase beta subunit